MVKSIIGCIFMVSGIFGIPEFFAYVTFTLGLFAFTIGAGEVMEKLGFFDA